LKTGWFVESLLTELAVAMVVRTRGPFFRSRPGKVLLWTTIALIAVAVAILICRCPSVWFRSADGAAARDHCRDHRALRRGDRAAQTPILSRGWWCPQALEPTADPTTRPRRGLFPTGGD
jgi:hypothetical protein